MALLAFPRGPVIAPPKKDDVIRRASARRVSAAVAGGCAIPRSAWPARGGRGQAPQDSSTFVPLVSAGRCAPTRGCAGPLPGGPRGLAGARWGACAYRLKRCHDRVAARVSRATGATGPPGTRERGCVGDRRRQGATLETARRLGIPAPLGGVVTEVGGVPLALNKVGLPAVGKPSASCVLN